MQGKSLAIMELARGPQALPLVLTQEFLDNMALPYTFPSKTYYAIHYVFLFMILSLNQ